MKTKLWKKDLMEFSSLSRANIAAAKDSMSIQVFLLFVLLFSLFLLDGGELTRILANVILPAIIAWWTGLLFIIIRRPNTEKKMDRMYLRFGIAPFLLFSLIMKPFWGWLR